MTDTRNESLTSVCDDDTVLARFKGLGLSSDMVVELAQMLARDELLKKYDFDNLKPDVKGMYRIWVDDEKSPNGKKRLYAKNIENLKDKVYQHITGRPGTDFKITFSQAFEEAQKYELTNTTPERAVSRSNTIDKNYYEYKRFFSGSEFEKRFISTITVNDLDEEIRTIMKTHKLTKSTMGSLRGLINMTFKRAYKMGWVEENIAQRLIWRDYNRFLHATVPPAKRAYTDGEIIQMVSADRERQKKDPAFITAYAHEFQAITAFRRGEICPLLWEDIDFERGIIYVHREQLDDRRNGHKQVIADYTKTHKDRLYPIADQEKVFLEKLYKIHEEYYPNSQFLFPANTENGCITCKAVEDYHRRLCKKLGILVTNDFRRGTHAFRRTRISDIVNETGGNVVLAAQMYGNSPETIRKHYYTQDSLENQREALNHRKVI